MNKLLIIPGFSLKNKMWAEEAKDYLKNDFSEILIHEWKHWKTENNDDFSLDNESNSIEEYFSNNSWYVLAKSMGSAVFVKTLPQILAKTTKIVLCGLPLEDLNNDEKELYISLKLLDSKKIVIFQNSEDNHGTYSEALEFVQGINRNIKIIEKSRSDHDYPYYEYFKQFFTSETKEN